MKRFIVSILCVSTFFIGLGGLVDSVGAKFKSDEKALQILALARQAVGGEANVRGVQSLSVTGKATKTFDFEGAQRSEQGDWELNLQLPNKFSKAMKVRIENNGSGEKTGSFDKEIIVRRGEGDKIMLRTENGELPKEGVFIVKKGDGEKVIVNEENTSGDAKKVVVDDIRASFEKIRHNELIRTTLALLLTTPQDVSAEYIYAGEASVDGNSCSIVEARVGDASIVKLYIDKSSNLPRMMSYTEAKPMMMFKIMKNDGDAAQTGDTKTFERKLDAPAMAEFQVKFSDYRSVGGLQLPFKWTQTVGGNADEIVDITSYEINPANIAERFKEMPLPQKIMIRTKKEQ